MTHLMCESCWEWGEEGTVCRQCGRGTHSLVSMPSSDTLWIINTESRSFDFFVVDHTPQACLRAFSRMWNDWCAKTGADPYYWGEKGDKWAEIVPQAVTMGKVYMDREVYR